ncbi:MAG: acyltransferase family protein [Dermatophilaceae bacterium]
MPDAAPSRSRPELKALTGLRAVAALAVVLSHTGLPQSMPEFAHKIVGWGFVGVPLFFMLSGFVLAYNYPDLRPGRGRGRGILKFYVARVARVMPLYWVMIAFCVADYYVAGRDQYPSALWQNVLAVQAWSPDVDVAQTHYNGPGWSIGVELFFYGLFPFLAVPMAALARRAGVRGLALFIASAATVAIGLWMYFWLSGRASQPASIPGSAHRWLYRNPLPHLVSFSTGMALAHIATRIGPWRVSTHHVIQTSVVAYVLLLAALRPSPSPFISAGSYGAMFVIPFAVAMLSLGSGHGWFGRLLSTRQFVTLGTASYALYLTHRWLIWRLDFGDLIGSARGFAPYVALILTVGILLLIAEGAHRYVENPARRWMVARFRRWTEPSTQERPGNTLVPDEATPASEPVGREQTAPSTGSVVRAR